MLKILIHRFIDDGNTLQSLFNESKTFLKLHSPTQRKLLWITLTHLLREEKAAWFQIKEEIIFDFVYEL